MLLNLIKLSVFCGFLCYFNILLEHAIFSNVLIYIYIYMRAYQVRGLLIVRDERSN